MFHFFLGANLIQFEKHELACFLAEGRHGPELEGRYHMGCLASKCSPLDSRVKKVPTGFLWRARAAQAADILALYLELGVGDLCLF